MLFAIDRIRDRGRWIEGIGAVLFERKQSAGYCYGCFERCHCNAVFGNNDPVAVGTAEVYRAIFENEFVPAANYKGAVN